MVFQPRLSVSPSDPATSEDIETGDDDSDRTDDAEGVPRFTKAACLPDTEE